MPQLIPDAAAITQRIAALPARERHLPLLPARYLWSRHPPLALNYPCILYGLLLDDLWNVWNVAVFEFMCFLPNFSWVISRSDSTTNNFIKIKLTYE